MELHFALFAYLFIKSPNMKLQFNSLRFPSKVMTSSLYPKPKTLYAQLDLLN